MGKAGRTLSEEAPGPVGWLRQRRRGGAFLALALVVLALDQFTKFLVRHSLSPGESFPEGWWVKLTYVTNTGAAFGILQGQVGFLIFSSFVGLLVILFYYWWPPRRSPYLWVTLGLVLGGAAGNLIDRLRLGHVIDFIDFPHWPAFNVADSSIVIGIAFLAWLLVVGKQEASCGREP